MCKSHEISNADIGEAIDFTPDISISYSPSSFIKYESNVRALLLDKEGKALASRFMDTLNKSLLLSGRGQNEENEKNSGLLGGFLNKFTS